MIVQKAQIDAKREGFLAAMAYAYHSSGAEHVRMAEEKFPYMQEREVEILVQDVPYLFKVQVEDIPDEYEPGTLLYRTMAKRSSWSRPLIYVSQFDAAGLRKLADLLENPLERYIPEPVKVPAE